MNMRDSWQPVHPSAAAAWLAVCQVPWWIAGGWALDLYLGRQTRAHGDLDIGVLRRDVATLLRQLPDWEIFEATGGVLVRLAPGRQPRPAVNSLWCRRIDERGWTLELLLDEATDDLWCYRRDQSIRQRLSTAIRRDADGVPYLAPEIQLLYKARSVRPRDQADFERVLPRLGPDARAWLTVGLEHTEPGHPWISEL